FSAYANVNPFAAATAMGPPIFSRNSPRSPKGNPFSSPSPTPNPFMSFVSKGNNYWSKMATSPAIAKDQKQESATVLSSSTPPVSSALTEDLPAVTPERGSAPSTASASATDTLGPSSNSSVGAEGPPVPNETTESHVSDANRDSDASSPQSPASSVVAADCSSSVCAADGGVGNGEQEEQCLLQLRAKLYRLSKRRVQSSNRSFSPLGGSSGSGDSVDAAEPNGESADKLVAEWVEIGTGPVRVLRPKGDSAAGQPSRLVMRREGQAGGVGTKLILNLLLDSSVTIAKQAERAIRLTCFALLDSTPAATASQGPEADCAGQSSGSVLNLLAGGNAAAQEGGSNSKTAVPTSYLLKTKHIKETDDLIALIRAKLPQAPEVAVENGK
ncbi:unnamed protein product, partial [Symbiodinium microadriaticum]